MTSCSSWAILFQRPAADDVPFAPGDSPKREYKPEPREAVFAKSLEQSAWFPQDLYQHIYSHAYKSKNAIFSKKKKIAGFKA
jgi:hypothetical protein